MEPVVWEIPCKKYSVIHYIDNAELNVQSLNFEEAST